MRERSIGAPLDIGAPLSGTDLAWLTAAGTAQAAERGDVIYTQGAPARTVFVIVHGQVKSTLVDPDGGQSLLRLHLSHSLLGLTALATRPVRDATAVALGPARLLGFPAAVFRALMRDRPDFAAAVVRLLVDRMSDFHHRVGALAHRPAAERLDRVLLALSRPEPGQTARQPIHMTHEDLAGLAGLRRQTVTALLQDMDVAGRVRRQGRTILVEAPLGDMSAG